jgi:predicted RNA-binding Zn-ribbon protein involved in translation (DUF1610 family)
MKFKCPSCGEIIVRNKKDALNSLTKKGFLKSYCSKKGKIVYCVPKKITEVNDVLSNFY